MPSWPYFYVISSTPDYDQLMSPSIDRLHSLIISSSLEITEHDYLSTTKYIDLTIFGVSMNQIGNGSFYFNFIARPTIGYSKITYELAIVRIDNNPTDVSWFQYFLT